MASTVEAFEQIKNCLANFQDFVLNGGAGSGKTHSLVEVINHLYNTNKNARIACITYTNVAADEIKKRVPYDNLWVSTIHDFLWNNIKSFQKNIKESIIALLNEGKISLNSSAQGTAINWNTIEKIEYREYRKLQDGTISHDDILKISVYMIKTYPLLSKIIADKFQYIFIDEYQDADKNVIEVFLNNISNNRNVIGLFGDFMQSIYVAGIGDVKNYIQIGKLANITKDDNYRCSIAVINLINKLRNDGIKQEPAKKDEHQNILNKTGSAYFLYSKTPLTSVSSFKNHDIFKEWNFTNPEKTKELYLTHRLIATQNKFANLFTAYSTFGQEYLTGDDKDVLLKHLLRIQEIIALYNNRKYNEVIKLVDLKVTNLRDKATLKTNIDTLVENYNSNIANVLQMADSFKLAKIDDDNLAKYFSKGIEEKNKYFDLWNALKNIHFKEIVNFYNYDLDSSIYSTQHGVKGAEFENVLVVLDNGKWNHYNFESLFTGQGNEGTVNRTKKIFYVACSRTENNLVVYYNQPSQSVINSAVRLFGADNIVEV
ncbi:MAG: AAA family ATPase [Paludibacter sp.]|nr:AAA family ATPase [Paludibacter sp.]